MKVEFMDLSKVKDRHKGKTAFVCGTGPSLRHLDPSALEPYVTFVVNASLLKVPKADYFVMTDGIVEDWEMFRKLNEYPCKLLVNGTGHGESRVNSDRVQFFERRSHNERPDEMYVMGQDADKILGTFDAIQCAVHFAYIMGCDPIVLLGADCSWEDGRKYYWMWEGQPFEPVDKATIDWWHDDCRLTKYKEEGKIVSDALIRGAEGVWGHVGRVNPGIPIINASGGVLNAFPRMKLDRVLHWFGDRKK